MKLALAFIVALPACAAHYTLKLDPAKTTVNWTLTDPLHTVRGTFRLKSGQIDFNPDTGDASGQITVDLPSGESGSAARDKRMHANVLESVKYPEAVFMPDHLEGTFAEQGGSTVKLHGLFRIHGTTHDLTMTIECQATAGHLTASAGFDVPYVAWGMKDPSNLLLRVGKTVRISLHAEAPLQMTQ